MATPTIKPHQVAESFVAVPGVVIEMIKSTVSPTAVAVSSGWTDILSRTFIAPVAGLYNLTWTGSCYTNGGSGTYRASFRANFDSDAQLITDDTAKVVINVTEERMYYTVQLQVELTAGSHDVAAQWLAITGTGVLTANTDDTVSLVGVLASGSGAAGVLPSRAQDAGGLISTNYISPWSPLEVAGLTQTITTVEGESVLVTFSGYAQQTGSGTTTAHAYLYIDSAGVSGENEFLTRQSSSIDWFRGDLSFSYVTAPLSAGSHTFRIYVAKAGSGETNWTLSTCNLHLLRFRGGLIPIERDGTIVHSTPRALNFEGAALQVAQSNDVVTVGLSDAVTGPGDLAQALGSSFTGGNVFINSTTWTQFLPKTGTESFTTLVNGTYRVDLDFLAYDSTGSGTLEFKVVIDEGEAEEVTVGADTNWRTRTAGNSDYGNLHFVSTAVLAFGAHTVKAYGRRVAGEAAGELQIVQEVSGTFPRAPTVTFQALVGSGAGGELIEDLDPDGTLVTLDKDVEETIVSDTITISDGDAIQVDFIGWSQKVDTSIQTSLQILLYANSVLVGDAPFLLLLKPETSGGGTRHSVSFSRRIVGLGAGTHTVEVRGLTTSGGGGNDYNVAPTTFQLSVARGGLVPIRDSGVQVVDKPAALNFQGAVQVVDASGVANIRMPDAITAPGQIRTLTEGQPASDINIDDTETQIYPESGADSYTVTTAGTHRVDLNLPLGGNGVDWNTYQFRAVFDEGLSSEVSIGYAEGWRARNSNAQWVYPCFFGNVELEARVYTVKVFAQRISGTGSAYIPDTSLSNQAVSVLVTAVTGSGAGGNLLAEDETTSNNVVTSNTAAVLPTDPLSISFESTDENVTLHFNSLISNTHSGASTVIILFYLDGSNVGAHQMIIPNAGWYETVSFSIPVAVTAGSHTAEIWGYTGATQQFRVQAGAKLWVMQDRGGLVPITDGFTTVDKPTSQKFVNASVTDNAGQAVVTLPEAVTVAGNVHEGNEGQRVTSVSVAGTETKIYPESGTDSFTALVAGEHSVALSLAVVGDAPDFNTHKYRVVFDKGLGSEVTIGYTEDWKTRGGNNEYQHGAFFGKVTLAAKTYTLEVYAQRSSGTGSSSIIGSATSDQQGVQVVVTAVSGSGAGGTLLAKATLSSDQATVSITNPPTVALANLDTLTINCVIGEVIDLRASGPGWSSGGATALVARFAVDGTPVQATNAFAESITGGIAVQCMFQESFVATATQHVVSFLASGASSTFTFYEGFSISAWQTRGGLVPIKNDGVLVQDKPHSFNLLGPGLSATNVNGAAHISVNSAAEGVETSSATTGNQTIVATSASPLPTPLTLDFVAYEGETIFVGVEFQSSAVSGGPNNYAKLRVDGIDATALLRSNASLPEERSQTVPYTIPEGGGTSHTLELYANTLSSTSWLIITPKIFVARFRGGYVVPENVPVLESSTAAVVNIVAAPGASSQAILSLNDGIRRRATLPLSIDMTGSGLGGLDTGSEAADTWYNIFAVPSATDGLFDVVASLALSSVGPTGFTAWKHLGWVRNDGSSDLLKMYQNGATFMLAAEINTFPTVVADGSPVLWDLSAEIPPSARQALLSAFIQTSSGWGLFDFWADGDQGGTRTAFAFTSLPGADVNDFAIATVTSPKQIYYQKTTAGTINGANIAVRGWVDGELSSLAAQTQARYDPDTPPPRGTWFDTTHVDFAAWPGHGSNLRLALSDGKTRLASGTLGVDKNNGIDDLGYDDASSQGNSKWLYFYAVPKTGDDDQFTIVMSDNDPTVGPLGRSASKYLWSTYIDGGGALIKVYQVKPDLFRRADNVDLNIGGGADGSPVLQSLVAYVPDTAAAVSFHNYLNGSGTYVTVSYWVDGDQAGGAAILNTAGYRNTLEVVVPTPTSPKAMYYKRSTGTSACVFYFDGWIDAYLAADAGIGVAVGGGTSSPLTTKGDVYTYDTDNQRLGVGSNGQVLTADSAEASGIKWAAISHPTQAYLREEAFSTTTGDLAGSTKSHVIAATPDTAGTTSGYDVVAYRNGLKMKNVATLTGAYDEFTFTVGTLTVAVTASGSADDYDVDFRS
jgi:hypothetical protein